MLRTFLFTNSQCHSDIKKLIKPDDYIIGVDGGINTLEQINLEPNLIIGDFDSVDLDNKYLSQNIKQITHQPEKDFTDTELAVDYALEHNFQPIIIVNDMQQRIDHVLGVLASLRFLNMKNITSVVLGDKQLFYILKQKNHFQLTPGITLSLIPLSDVVSGITTKGLYYPLKNEDLVCDRARGVSNVVSKEKVEITFDRGELLMVVNFDEFLQVKEFINNLT